jgi:alginate O-acetyltransferase complex protein AlgI
MSISSAPFFVFLLGLCLVYWAAAGSRRLQYTVLIAANLFFAAKFSLIYLLLPLAASLDYICGIGLSKFKSRGRRLALLSISLAVNLGMLAGLKLIPLFTAGRFAWLLTLSLSFYCFQSLSYTIDLYRGDIKPARSYLAILPPRCFSPRSRPVLFRARASCSTSLRGHSPSPRKMAAEHCY